MSRTQSQGIDFFPFSVDFFSDSKIRILKARYGTDGIAIYVYLLCKIYKEGYYIYVDDDLIFVIADELNISSDTVQQVMTFLLKRSMFNEQLFKSDAVLTSDGIQERWQKAVKTRAAKTPIKVCNYWLLKKEDTAPYIKCALFLDNSEKEEDNSEKEEDNSEKKSIKESKHIKEESLSPPIIPPKGEGRNYQRKFFDEFDLKIDNYDSSLFSSMTENDWEQLFARFQESEWLKKNVRTTSMLCKLYRGIIEGRHAPFEKVEKNNFDHSSDEKKKNAEWFEKNFGNAGMN